MALTVTPGGASDDALLTLAAWKTYAAAQGWTYSGVYTDAQIEASIRRGTVYVEGLGAPSRSGGVRWPGERATSTQRRVWPRTGATYLDGTVIASDVIPGQVGDAVAEAAWYDLNNAGKLQGSVVSGLKSAGAGPARVEFMEGASADDMRSRLAVVSDLLADILRPASFRGDTFALVV